MKLTLLQITAVVYGFLIFALNEARILKIAVFKNNLPKSGARQIGIGSLQICEKGIVYDTIAEIDSHTAAVAENTAVNSSLVEMQV